MTSLSEHRVDELYESDVADAAEPVAETEGTAETAGAGSGSESDERPVNFFQAFGEREHSAGKVK